MAETVVKTISFRAEFSAEVRQDSSHDDNEHSNAVSAQTGGASISVVALESNFHAGYDANIFFPAVKTNITVTKVELEFWHYQADLDEPIKSLDFISFGTSLSAGVGDWGAFYTSINGGTAIKALATHGIEKTKVTVDLGSAICTTFTTRIKSAVVADHYFNVGIRRTAQTSTERGTVYIGGPNLLSDVGSGWEAADGTEIASPPRFIITYTNEEDEAQSVFNFRYTTQDPTDTTGQQTPRNSIGGWAAPNEPYVKTTIHSAVDPSQTTITLDPDAAATQESSGLAQIGLEIIKYAGFNSSGRQLTGGTRATVPGVASTAVLEPYKDTVRYLLVNNLFDNKPSASLKQYRCIAVVHESSDDQYVENVKIYLAQNAGSDVIVDIGIEVPEYDARTGTFAATMDSGEVTFTSTDISGDIVSGLFESGHIVINPTGTVSHAIINSFDVTGNTGEFILDRSFSTNITAGTSFRINPAAAQRTANDFTKPTENSSRFLGFLSEDGADTIGFDSIRDREDRMNDFDSFYLWIERSLTNNKPASDDTGAIIIIEYDESVRF